MFHCRLQEYINRSQASRRDQSRRSSHDLSRGSHRSQSPDGRVRLLRHRAGDKRTLDASCERGDPSEKRRREDAHIARSHTEGVAHQKRHDRPSDNTSSRGHTDQPRRVSSQHNASPSCVTRLSDPRTEALSPAIRDVRYHSDPDLKSPRVCRDRDGDRRRGRFQDDSRSSSKKEDWLGRSESGTPGRSKNEYERGRSEAGTPEVATPADDCETEVSEQQESGAVPVKKTSSQQLGISDYERMRGYLSLQQKRTLAQQISLKDSKRLRNRMIADYSSRSADYDEYMGSLHREKGSVANIETPDSETNDTSPCGDSKDLGDVMTSSVALHECTLMAAQTVSTHGRDLTGVLESAYTAKGEPTVNVITENSDQMGVCKSGHVSSKQKRARSMVTREERMASLDTRESRVVSSGYGSVDTQQTTGDVSKSNISDNNGYSNTASLLTPSNTKSRLVSNDLENTAPLGVLLSVLKQSCSRGQLTPSTTTGQTLQSAPVASLLNMLYAQTTPTPGKGSVSPALSHVSLTTSGEKMALQGCVTTAISSPCSSNSDATMLSHSQIVRGVSQDLNCDSKVQQANPDKSVMDSSGPTSTRDIDTKKSLNDITLGNSELLHTFVETENRGERNDKRDIAVQEVVVNLKSSKVRHSAAKSKSSAKRHKVIHTNSSTADQSKNNRSGKDSTIHRKEKQITQPGYNSTAPNCSILVTSVDDTSDSIITSSQPHVDITTVDKSFSRAIETTDDNTGTDHYIDSDVSDSFVIDTSVSSVCIDNHDSSSGEMDLWDISLQSNNTSKGDQCRSAAADSQSRNHGSLGHKSATPKDAGAVSGRQLNAARNILTDVSAQVHDTLVLKSQEHHATDKSKSREHHVTDKAKSARRSSSGHKSKTQPVPLVVDKSKLNSRKSQSKAESHKGSEKKRHPSAKERLTCKEKKPSKSRVASSGHDNTSPHGMLNQSCNNTQPTTCANAGQTSQSASVATLVDQTPPSRVLSEAVSRISSAATDSSEKKTLPECTTTAISPGCSSTPDVTMLANSQLLQGVPHDLKCDSMVQRTNQDETVIDSSKKSLATSEIDMKLPLNDIRPGDIQSLHTDVETESSNNLTKVSDMAVQEETVHVTLKERKPSKDRRHCTPSDSADSKRQSSAKKHKAKQDRNKNDLSSEKCGTRRKEKRVTGLEQKFISNTPICSPLMTCVDGTIGSIITSSQPHAGIATVEKNVTRAIDTTCDDTGVDNGADSDVSDSAFVIDTDVSPVKNDNRNSSSGGIAEDLWDISLQSNSIKDTRCRKVTTDLQSRNCRSLGHEATGSKKERVGGMASRMQLDSEENDSTNVSAQVHGPLDVSKSRDHRKSHKAPVVRRSSGDKKGKARHVHCVDNKSRVKSQSKEESHKAAEKKHHPSNQHQLTQKDRKPSKSRAVSAAQENATPHGMPLSVPKHSCDKTQPTPSTNAGQTSHSAPVVALVGQTTPSPGKDSLSGVVPRVSDDKGEKKTLPECNTLAKSSGSSTPDVTMLAHSVIVQSVPRDLNCDSTVQRTNLMDSSEPVLTDDIDIKQSLNDIRPGDVDSLHTVVETKSGRERTTKSYIAVQEETVHLSCSKDTLYWTASDSSPTELKSSAKRRKVLPTKQDRNKDDLSSEKCAIRRKERQITEPEYISTSPNCAVLLPSVDDTTDSEISGSRHHADIATVEKGFSRTIETMDDNTGADDDADSDDSDSAFVIDTTVSPVKSDNRESSSGGIDEDLWDISLKSNRNKDSHFRDVRVNSQSSNRGSSGEPRTKDGGVVSRRQLDGVRNDAARVTAHARDPRGVVKSRDHRTVDRAPMVCRDDCKSNARQAPRVSSDSKRKSRPNERRVDGPEKKLHLSNQHRLTQMESNDYRRPAHHHDRPQTDAVRRRSEDAGTRITTPNRSRHIASSSPVRRGSGMPERGSRGRGDGIGDPDHNQKERRTDMQSPSQRRSVHRGSKDRTSGGLPSSNTKRAVGDMRDNDSNTHARTPDTRHKYHHSRTHGVGDGFHDGDHLRAKAVVGDKRGKDPMARKQSAVNGMRGKDTGARAHSVINDERDQDIYACTHAVNSHDKRNRARKQSEGNDMHGEDNYVRTHRPINDTRSKDTNARTDGAVYDTPDKNTGTRTQGVDNDSRNKDDCTPGVVSDTVNKDTPTPDVSTAAQDDSTEEGEIVSDDEEVTTSYVSRRAADSCRPAGGVDTLQEHGNSRPRSSHGSSGRRTSHSTKTKH